MGADTLSLAGKFALVTGSSKEHGIGAAIARGLARNGASVAIHYVSESSKISAEGVAANITKEFGTKTTVVRGAIEEAGTAKTIVEDTLKGLNTDHIDILVNNAGGGDSKPLMDITPEQLQHEFGLNVYGTIYLTQAVVGIGKMPQGGRIVNVSSIASKLGLDGVTVYSAAKAAQDSITASLAGELGKSRGITVNSVAPGPVPTETSKPFLEKPDGSPSEMQAAMIAMTRAAARVGTTEDIADAVLLLASEKSRWITAQWISVSGGITGTM
ncbi:short chain dehydrogenase reductase [Coniochaeta ligniaria NRRL 30616]|uniref:Short chain dehydrogenase reductase n=1 Tax=Coniochaeta ligniaria NRRL 30616 TaxID=1408157 RepID=A0A1J7JG99_9PEZI|nr:short chain dehydrogenase reductase [Coniochaeta ligniaria NRRL 30616]